MPEKRVTVRGPEELFKRLEAEAKTQGKSNNQTMLDIWERGLKSEATKYKGLRLLRMSKDFTCYNCQKKHKAGRQAFYDAETGATLCLECAIEEGITPETNVKKAIKLLERKKLSKDFDLMNAKKGEEYIELIENIEMEHSYDEVLKRVDEEEREKLRWLNTSSPDPEIKERQKHCEGHIFAMKQLKELAGLHHERAMKVLGKRLEKKQKKAKKKKKPYVT